MTRRISLSTKIFLLGFLNLALLGVLLLIYARLQLHADLGSLLMAPAQDRVVSVARQVALDLAETPAAGRTTLLERYTRIYGAQFYLFRMPPQQIAGPTVDLPPEVRDELRRPPRGEAARRPPPPRDDRKREYEEKKGEGPPPDDDAPPDGRPRKGPPPPRPDAPPPVRTSDDQDLQLRPDVFAAATSNPSLYWAGARIPLRELGSDETNPGILLMAAGSFVGTPLFFDYKPWLAIAGAMILVFVVCWLPFIRGLTHTIAGMSRATEEIAEGRFDHKLAEDRSDELGALAGGINRMASRLAGFVGGQKRFLGDIAHELCAPLARIQFGLGILENRVDTEHRSDVDTVGEDVRQMSNLVEELLSFSKAGMLQGSRTRTAVDVARTVQGALDREAISPDKVEVSVEPGLAVLADGDYLLRSIANLLRNAVRYAGDAGPVIIRARREKEQVVILIADNGPGIPQDELDRVFMPFYRLENSRNRTSGGVGLGLAIVRSCIEACKGTVSCRNRVPSGLEVELRLESVNDAMASVLKPSGPIGA